ncbi:MAG: tripartite tricarboxylate transporter permease [Candidatus Woesearchaeota archaeon]
MISEILLAILLGVVAGTFTGITPGIHINLVAALVATLYPALATTIPLLYVLVAILSMAITHTFLDALPSVYLGAPSEAMAMTALPAHQLLLEGKGHEALLLCIWGSLCSLLAVLILFFPLTSIIVWIYLGKAYFKYLILILVLWLIISEKNKFAAFLVFLGSGLLGIALLNTANEPFYLLFTGFFGIGMLLTSISNIPKQTSGEEKLPLKPKLTGYSMLAGIITGLFPGTTNSTAAALFPIKEKRAYLIFISGINTASMLVSFATLYTIAKTRNGIMIALQQMLASQNAALTLSTVLVLLCSALCAGSIAVLVALGLSKKIAALFAVMDYQKVKWIVIGCLCLLALFFDKLLGLVGLGIATSISLFAQSYQVKRSLMLGCLLLPLLTYYFL